MPVRLLSSSVLKWPDRQTVKQAAVIWAQKTFAMCPDVMRIGYFGSYARGNWGVGSDIDILIVVKDSDLPMGMRALRFETESLPVPTDLLVYTADEWNAIASSNSKFARMIAREAEWLR